MFKLNFVYFKDLKAYTNICKAKAKRRNLIFR